MGCKKCDREDCVPYNMVLFPLDPSRGNHRRNDEKLSRVTFPGNIAVLSLFVVVLVDNIADDTLIPFSFSISLCAFLRQRLFEIFTFSEGELNARAPKASELVNRPSTLLSSSVNGTMNESLISSGKCVGKKKKIK